MKLEIEKYYQTLEELQTNEEPYLRFTISSSPVYSNSIVEVYYGFTKCTCNNYVSSEMCEHISYITNNFLIKNLKDLYLIDNRADISLYNFTNGEIMNIDIHSIQNNISNIIKENHDCPICLGKIKVAKVNCTTCVEKYHVNCVLKTKKRKCPVCRCDLDTRID